MHERRRRRDRRTASKHPGGGAPNRAWGTSGPSGDGVRPGRTEDRQTRVSRAEAFEARGLTLEAVLAYAEVFTAELDVVEPTLDIATGLHGAGELAAEVGDHDTALVNYVSAARVMGSLGLPRRCGDSLAAAGFNLAKSRSWIPSEQVIDQDLVRTGFGGVLEETRGILLAAEPPTLRSVGSPARDVRGDGHPSRSGVSRRAVD